MAAHIINDNTARPLV